MSDRKLVLLEHVSLDGFLAGADGAMDWIRLDDEIFDAVVPLTDSADTAVFGRVTYQMMEGYWPTAADQPGATPHDIQHGRWLQGATKLVFSRALETAPWGAAGHAQVVRDDPGQAMQRLKAQPGANLLLIGSASLARTFSALGLIDDYHLFLNPVILGGGTPLYPQTGTPRTLQLVAQRTFPSGVLGLHYTAAP